jgi:hypothetical protein
MTAQTFQPGDRVRCTRAASEQYVGRSGVVYRSRVDRAGELVDVIIGGYGGPLVSFNAVKLDYLGSAR